MTSLGWGASGAVSENSQTHPLARVLRLISAGWGQLVRFVAGASLRGVVTNASWVHRGTHAVLGRELTWWSALPRWPISLARTVLVFAVWILALSYPIVLGIFAGLVLGGSLLVWAVRRGRRLRFYRQQLWNQLSLFLGVSPTDPARHWLRVPSGVDDVDNRQVRVAVTLPTGWQLPGEEQPEAIPASDALEEMVFGPAAKPDANQRLMELIGILDQHLPGMWQEAFYPLDTLPPYVIDIARAPLPPVTTYDPTGFPWYNIPFGAFADKQPISIDLQGERPHMLIAAAPGMARRAVRIPITHLANTGALIDVCTTSQNLARVYRAVPGVRVHTTAASMAAAITNYSTSITAAYRVSGAGTGVIRLLVLDGLDQLARVLDRYWASQQPQTQLAAQLPLLWQGHICHHYTLITTNCPELALVANSGIDTGVGSRIAIGPQSRQGWQALFGEQVRPINVAGAYTVVGDQWRVTEARLSILSTRVARQLAIPQTPVPQWWTNNQPAPWIGGEIVSQ